jgi:hypothetical protein
VRNHFSKALSKNTLIELLYIKAVGKEENMVRRNFIRAIELLYIKVL